MVLKVSLVLLSTVPLLFRIFLVNSLINEYHDLLLVNDHQDEFDKLIADIRKRQKGKKNKSAAKASGKKNGSSCFMCFTNHVFCILCNQLKRIFALTCTLFSEIIEGVIIIIKVIV